MRKGPQARCIVFLHLPKTAGTTLKAVLRYKHPTSTLVLENTSDPFGGIADVPAEARRRARVVTGHVHYGVHELIPQPCDHITVLREPVSRVVSMYGHARRHPKHRFHREAAAVDLEEFVRTSEDPGLDNLQTRMISGRKPGKRDNLGDEPVWSALPLDRDDLEAAKRNLDRFLVVGLTERFDESFILIRRALGWRFPMYETRNVGRDQPESRPEPPSAAALEAIRSRNELDLELYAYARELFEAAVAAQGPSFRREVAAFKLFNPIPNSIAPRMPAAVRTSLRALLPR